MSEEAINSTPVTTPAPSAEPITDVGGSSGDSPVLSFKALEESYDKAPPTEKAEKTEKAPISDEDEDGDDEDDDIEGDSEEGDEGDSGDDEEEASEEEESEDGEEKDWKEKVLSEFDEDGKLTIKVGGKDTKFNLEQVKSIVASGAHTLNQRQAFEAERKQSTAQLKQMQNQLLSIHEAINPAWQALEKGNLEETFLELASAKGKSRLESRRELRDAFIPVVSEYLGISKAWVEERLKDPELRSYQEILKTREENHFLKEEAERAKAKAPQPPKGMSPGVAKMRQIQLQMGLPDAKIAEAVKLCRDAGEITGKEQDFPVDLVLGKLTVLTAVDRGVDTIMAIRPKLAENPKFVDSIIEVIKKNPSIDNVELAKIVRKRAKKMARQEEDQLTREVSRKALRGKDKSALRSPNKAMPGRKMMSFRDLPVDELV